MSVMYTVCLAKINLHDIGKFLGWGGGVCRVFASVSMSISMHNYLKGCFSLVSSGKLNETESLDSTGRLVPRKTVHRTHVHVVYNMCMQLS